MPMCLWKSGQLCEVASSLLALLVLTRGSVLCSLAGLDQIPPSTLIEVVRFA